MRRKGVDKPPNLRTWLPRLCVALGKHAWETDPLRPTHAQWPVRGRKDQFRPRLGKRDVTGDRRQALPWDALSSIWSLGWCFIAWRHKSVQITGGSDEEIATIGLFIGLSHLCGTNTTRLSALFLSTETLVVKEAATGGKYHPLLVIGSVQTSQLGKPIQ